MSEIAIRAENLSKRYRIGRRAAGRLSAPWQYLRDQMRQPQEDEILWALRDVSFDVNRGEAVGIIGRNGAGKSTLLKILSRISSPSGGRAEIRGRVGSLLEVGTGFHHELTGRENIYMNGAILGMKRAEIDRKFDEIVAFAEVEQFLDTPVKRYSSGMYVRLAFAVAAHLEPEILIVDEVLAVGDARFQQKCLGKMGQVAQTGRTVLFVSHNMAAISGLCARAVVMDRGRVQHISEVSSAMSFYLQAISGNTQINDLKEIQERRGNGSIRFTSFWIEDDKGERISQAFSGEHIRLVAEYETNGQKLARDVGLQFMVSTSDGIRLTNLSSDSVLGHLYQEIPPQGKFICEIPRMPLRTGRYLLDLFCEAGGLWADWIQHAGVIEVVDGDYYGTSRIATHYTGSVFFDQNWKCEAVDTNKN